MARREMEPRNFSRRSHSRGATSSPNPTPALGTPSIERSAVARATSWEPGHRQPPRARRPRIGRRRFSSTSSRGSRLRCRPADRRGRVAARTLHSFAVRSRGGAAMRARASVLDSVLLPQSVRRRAQVRPVAHDVCGLRPLASDLQLELVVADRARPTRRISGGACTRGNPEHHRGVLPRQAGPALDRHLENRGSAETERAAAVAGIHCWAAESLFALEGPSARCRSMLQRALAAVPDYPRALRMTARLRDSPDDTRMDPRETPCRVRALNDASAEAGSRTRRTLPE